MKALMSTSIAVAGILATLPALAQVHASEAPPPRSGTPVVEPMDRGEPQGAPGKAKEQGGLAESGVFLYQDLPERTAANGSESRTITHGTLRTGETVNLHESMQPGGAEPVALHVIHHSEFVCVQQGELTFDHVDANGKTVSETAGPGSVIYVAEGTNHRVRNSGPEPAKYFVIAIGGDAK